MSDGFIIDSIKEELLEEMRQDGRQLVIYPANKIGRRVAQICQDAGLTIAAWADDDVAKDGTEIDGIKSYTPANCLRKYPDASLIIAFYAAFSKGLEFYHKGVRKFYFARELVFDTMPSGHDGRYALTDEEYCNFSAVFSTRSLFQTGFRTLPYVSMAITEYCSLNCEDCSQMMPYYNSKRHYPMEELIQDVDYLLDYIPGLDDFSLVGGEPLVHPEWWKLVNYLDLFDKIQTIRVITNGTVIPRDEILAQLSKRKLMFYVSGYNITEKNHKKLSEILTSHKIWHYIFRYPDDLSWCKINQPKKYNRTPKQNKAVYKACEQKYCYNYSQGKLYKCYYGVPCVQLNLVPSDVEGYIDFRELHKNGVSKEEALNLISEYITTKEPLELCDYCDGPLCKEYVKPGKQLKRK